MLCFVWLLLVVYHRYIQSLASGSYCTSFVAESHDDGRSQAARQRPAVRNPETDSMAKAALEPWREVDGVLLARAWLAQVGAARVEAVGPAHAGRHHATQPQVVGCLHQHQVLRHVVQVAREIVVGQSHQAHRVGLPATHTTPESATTGMEASQVTVDRQVPESLGDGAVELIDGHVQIVQDGHGTYLRRDGPRQLHAKTVSAETHDVLFAAYTKGAANLVGADFEVLLASVVGDDHRNPASQLHHGRM